MAIAGAGFASDCSEASAAAAPACAQDRPALPRDGPLPLVGSRPVSVWSGGCGTGRWTGAVGSSARCRCAAGYNWAGSPGPGWPAWWPAVPAWCNAGKTPPPAGSPAERPGSWAVLPASRAWAAPAPAVCHCVRSVSGGLFRSALRGFADEPAPHRPRAPELWPWWRYVPVFLPPSVGVPFQPFFVLLAGPSGRDLQRFLPGGFPPPRLPSSGLPGP